MKTVSTPTPSVSTSVILSEARLEMGAVDTPMSAPVEQVPLPHDNYHDNYDAAGRDAYQPADTCAEPRTDKPTSSELDKARGDNPFGELQRSDATDVRLSDNTVGTDVPLEATQAQLARLNAVLLAMTRAGKEIPSHLLDAFMMITHDAQTAEHPLPPDQQAKLTQYAAKLAQNEATTADHKLFWAQAGAGEENVMAYVQRVMRESYLMGNGIMSDMAAQLKKTNDLRKKVRDEVSKARNAQASWAGQSKGDKAWLSNTPYPAMTVNEDAGELEPDVMDEQELQQHQAELDAQSSSGSMDLSVALASLSQDSKLSTAQQYNLGLKAKGAADANNDTAIEAIIEAIPSMNGADLKTYLEPILDRLNGDNILKVFGALNVAQMLTVVGDGYTIDKFMFHVDADQFRDLTQVAVLNYLPTPPSIETPEIDWGSIYAGVGGGMDGGMGSTGYRDTGLEIARAHDAANQLSEDDAKRTLEKLVALDREKLAAVSDTVATDGSKVGDQRTINTVDGMAAYIKNLEDTLNSMGDDSQLMQVDLQNALQKNQTLMQMMSNLLKVVHDTAMAEIRNTNS